jgi:FlaA1/EpsC-like NDP-sugar epimerase
LEFNLLDKFKNPRILTALLFDAFCAILGGYLALFLRFESLSKPFELFPDIHQLIVITVICQIVAFQFSGLYAGMWRFSSTNDLIRIFKGVSIGIAASLIINVFLNRLVGIPRSFFLLDWILLIMMLGSGRFLYRIQKDARVIKKYRAAFGEPEKTIIIGAGYAADRLFRDRKANAPGL